MRALPTRIIAPVLYVTVAALAAAGCSSKEDSDKPASETPAPVQPASATPAPAKPNVPATPAEPDEPDEDDAEPSCQPLTDGSLDCAESARTSPFTCVRYNADCSVDVQLGKDSDFYRLAAIDGIPVETLIGAAKTGCKDGARNWKKRLAEDLSQVMKASCGDAAGQNAGQLDSGVDLQLRALHDGQVTDEMLERKGVASTNDNRQAIKACWEQHDKCSQ